MRPTIKELYNIDATTLRGVPEEKALQIKIDAATARKKKLSDEITVLYNKGTMSYEVVSAINAQIKYLDKTLDGLNKDLEEVMA